MLFGQILRELSVDTDGHYDPWGSDEYDDDRDEWTSGGCHIFALAWLKTHRGWGLMAVVEGRTPVHVFAMAPDGTCVDAYGSHPDEARVVHNASSSADDPSGVHVVGVDEQQIRRWVSRGFLDPYRDSDIARAQAYIKANHDKFPVTKG